MSSEKDKVIAKCQALGVRTVGCRTTAQYRAALDAQAPGWRAETPQQPSNVIAQARAREASSGPAAPSARSLVNLSRAADWTRQEVDNLLIGFEDGKTGQELADAVGGGRSREECEKKLKRLMPPPQLAYDWDEHKPRKHTEKIRAELPAAEQNLSAPKLRSLWLAEREEFCVDAVKRVVNINLGELASAKKECVRKLVLMGLPPSAFRTNPKPKLRSTDPFRRRSRIVQTNMISVASNRAAREAMLAGDPLQSPYALLNPDGTRQDKACYEEMRKKGACLVAIGMGANEETEMPTGADLPEIVAWTTKPSFERLKLPRAKTSFAEASFARQFCFICCSLFVLKGGRVFVEHCKVRKHRRGVHGFCRMCNVGVLFLADEIRSAVEKAGLSRSVALKAVGIIADASEVEDAVFDDMFDCD